MENELFEKTKVSKAYMTLALPVVLGMVVDVYKRQGYDVISIGKINDIFCGEGITESLKSKSSVHGMEQTIETAGKDFTGLCFVTVSYTHLWQADEDGYRSWKTG